MSLKTYAILFCLTPIASYLLVLLKIPIGLSPVICLTGMVLDAISTIFGYRIMRSFWLETNDIIQRAVERHGVIRGVLISWLYPERILPLLVWICMGGIIGIIPFFALMPIPLLAPPPSIIFISSFLLTGLAASYAALRNSRDIYWFLTNKTLNAKVTFKKRDL